jgi:hypothetical protein
MLEENASNLLSDEKYLHFEIAEEGAMQDEQEIQDINEDPGRPIPHSIIGPGVVVIPENDICGEQ